MDKVSCTPSDTFNTLHNQRVLNVVDAYRGLTENVNPYTIYDIFRRQRARLELSPAEEEHIFVCDRKVVFD